MASAGIKYDAKYYCLIGAHGIRERVDAVRWPPSDTRSIVADVIKRFGQWVNGSPFQLAAIQSGVALFLLREIPTSGYSQGHSQGTLRFTPKVTRPL